MTKKENAASSSNSGATQEYIDGRTGTSGTTKKQNQLINVDRNKTRAERLPQYFEHKNQSFIAIENFPLGDKEGIVERLKQKDYEVSKITS